MFDRERLISAHDRKQRRSGIKLIVVSGLFVVAGLILFVGTGEPVGLVALLFFGGCLLVGVHLVMGEDRLAGRALLVIAAFIAAAGCASGAVYSSLGFQIGRSWQTAEYIVPVMIVAAMLFGGAGIVSLVQLVRFRGPNDGGKRRSR
ncbi:hypothetical protein [Brevibacterium yomogidense]|uniref:hypothetical protein n=1 Tax=Brevibacterium yomogidense TaxID=946573 RepID=UPI0018E01A4F|nr:hypothetical protein [Brevibacterium yomogidense]